MNKTTPNEIDNYVPKVNTKLARKIMNESNYQQASSIPMLNREVFYISDLAELTGRTTHSIRDWIRRGVLRYRKQPNRTCRDQIKFTRSEFADALEDVLNKKWRKDSEFNDPILKTKLRGIMVGLRDKDYELKVNSEQEV